MKTTDIQRLIGALLLTGIMLAGCTKDNTLDEIVNQKEQQTTVNDIVEALQAIDGVRNVQMKTTLNGEDTIYFFSYQQLVNHGNPDAGTFDQQVALKFKGFDKNVVLYTNGYNLSVEAEEYRSTDMATQLDANQVSVEHRYFGNSQPEMTDKLEYTYFNAEQQAHDLHAIVQTLKENLFKTGKWVSTGISKDGITTALYAYYSDLNGWNDIDVFVPFCAPFLPGSTKDGKFSCMDCRTGEYLEQVCGAGYPEGSEEAKACQRLYDIAKYICTNKRVREVCNKYVLTSRPADYRKIVEQYNLQSPKSTGDLEKDATAMTYTTFYGYLFNKFSYVQFPLWAKLVPDPAVAVNDDDEMDHLCTFITMDHKMLADSLKAMSEHDMLTRNDATDAFDKLWYYIKGLRGDSSQPYDLQAFMELGAADYGYNTVDGNFLTKEQAEGVNEMFTVQKHFEGLYYQDQGKLMRNFRQWVATESTQNIIFVYAYNDPWTGGRPDDTAVRQNPKTEMVIDLIAVHNDYFLNKELFTTESRTAIINALDRFMK